MSLGQRFKARREEFGAGLAVVSRWSGLSESRIREIEAGEPFDSNELADLCQGLAVDIGAFLREEEKSPKRSVARFRSSYGVQPTLDDLRLLSMAAEAGRIGGFLAQQLGNSFELQSARSPTPLQEKPAWRQGYDLGEQARRILKPRWAPITELETFLRELGVHVVRVELGSSIEAASLWEPQSLPVILLNARLRSVQSSLSRRALLAHELCHLLHDSGERDLTTQLSWTEGYHGSHEDAIEQRARAFAPAFLAPRDEVRAWLKTHPQPGPMTKVEVVAERWGFSLEGAVWHAKNCGVIQEKTAEKLAQELTPRDHGWAKDFEQETDDEGGRIVSGLFLELVQQAAEAGVISSGRAGEIMAWN